MTPRYPLMVDLAGRPCLVVGGGEVAARKVQGLLDVGAEVTVRSPELCPSLAALVDGGRVRWEAHRYGGLGVAEGGRPWILVVAATDDPAVNAAVGRDADAVGTFANVATDPVGGSASLPAAWRQGRLTVAVSTDGVHPGAARWLRDRAVEGIGPEPVVALELVEALEGRPDWRCAVDSGMLEAIRAGHLAEAKERLEACLSSSSD